MHRVSHLSREIFFMAMKRGILFLKVLKEEQRRAYRYHQLTEVILYEKSYISIRTSVQSS